MATEKPEHPLLQRPLYIFDLPEEILLTLTIKDQRGLNTIEPEDTRHSSKHKEAESDPVDKSPSSNTSCGLCNLSFPNHEEQRSHVRSDLHNYNLKQKIKGLKPVSEVEFERLIGDLDESISGSDSSDTEDEDEAGGKSKDTTLSALLKKQAKLAGTDSDDFSLPRRKQGAGKPPLIWFSTPALPQNLSLGVYRAVFSGAEQEEESGLVGTIKSKQLAPIPVKQAKEEVSSAKLPGPHYFLCMIGGGHFAAMIVSLTPKIGKQHTGADQRQTSVLAHKTFRRYTTRRKQGGSQSANDNSKGNAHSAGSSLRRYNEAALQNEIRELLTEWKGLIDTSELLFVRATGSTNRRTLFGPYEGQVLRHNDPRNRGFPFSTRRATQSELMRAYVELTRVKVSNISEAALEAASAEPKTEQTSTPKPPKPKPAKISKGDEVAAMHTTQVTALIRRSKAPALLSYLSSNSLSPDFTFYPPSQYHHTRTPLQLAASINIAPVVTALLMKAKADPTIMNDEARTAFQLAGDRATRDAFRVARSELGESSWDWAAANVPAALSKTDADARTAREVNEKKEADAEEAERRKNATERLRQEDAKKESDRVEKRHGKGRSMGVLEKTGAEKREEEGRGMSEEMKKKLERERRARAAEERMKRFAQGIGGGGGA